MDLNQPFFLLQLMYPKFLAIQQVKVSFSMTTGKFEPNTESGAQKTGFLLMKTVEPRHEKTNVLVSDLVRHKPGCTATEDG